MKGIIFINDFVKDGAYLFDKLKTSVSWDESMSARHTASYGVAYNYSQMSYPFQQMPSDIENLCNQINDTIGFKPNNCLINYYLDGKSKMGFHSDQTDILVEGTGVAIVSLGETRILRFRNIADQSIIVDYELPMGSLIYMDQQLQDNWHHAIPKSDTDNGRMSLTFRMMK